MRIIHFALCLSLTTGIAAPARAQFSIPSPVVGEGAFAFQDTVYMAPSGNDADPGTFDQPVASFAAALARLPFGDPDTNSGHAYGLIRMKPGFYPAPAGFRQPVSQWKNGNTYKDVSLEGIGTVIIGGSRDTFSQNHLLHLLGDHILIRNIRLRYSTGIGILLSRNEPGEPRQRHVLIEDVTVDSVGSFAMLLRGVDTIRVSRSVALYAARPGHDQLASPCQWPSGIKFLNSRDCRIEHSEVAYTRGEGLNFHSSRRCEAADNRIHDNSTNIYCDNSSILSVHHNLIYNDPEASELYWRSCPADTLAGWSGSGMLIANEGSCDLGSLPVFDGCETRCILPEEHFPNVDSLFIYNNLWLRTGSAFQLWEGVTSILGANCIRNVFIVNNTVAGVLGDPSAGPQNLVNAFFPGYNILINSNYSTLSNVRILNNILAWDTTAWPQIRAAGMQFHPFHPGPRDIAFSGNLWARTHPFPGPDDQVRSGLSIDPGDAPQDLSAMLPCPENEAFIQAQAPAFPWLTDDFLHQPRDAQMTNAGAFERPPECMPNATADPLVPIPARLYPNPCQDCETIRLSSPYTGPGQLYDVSGRHVAFVRLEAGWWYPPAGLDGLFFLRIGASGDARQTLRVMFLAR